MDALLDICKVMDKAVTRINCIWHFSASLYDLEVKQKDMFRKFCKAVSTKKNNLQNLKH